MCLTKLTKTNHCESLEFAYFLGLARVTLETDCKDMTKANLIDA